ncbi:DUF72 domain-containing protein [Oceanithermus sp.]
MLFLGTSGWPREGEWLVLTPRQRRQRYFSLFNSIEVRETYNRVPDWELVSRRRAEAPEGFVYSWVAPRHLTYHPGGEERRSLRRFLRRHRRLGRARGAVRFLVPPKIETAAFAEWLAMLSQLGLPGDYAFSAGQELAPLLEPYGWVVVNQPASWQYALDARPDPGLPGYAYFSSLAVALRYQREVAAQGG